MKDDHHDDLSVAAERSDKLTNRFCEAINADPELTTAEIYIAAIGILGNTLFNSRCNGCRKAARENISAMVTEVMQSAMVEAAKRDLAEPPSETHLH